MDAMASIGQPCPPQRAAYLVSAYDGTHAHGGITKEEMQRLLRDASDTSRAQSELRLAWGTVVSQRRKVSSPRPVQPAPAGFYRPLSKVRLEQAMLPSMEGKSSRQLLAAYRKARALNPPTKFNVDPSEKKLVPKEEPQSQTQTTGAAKKESRSRLDAGRPIAGQISDLLKAQMKEMITLMREWDEDGSNSISYAEFEKAMTGMGLKSNQKIRELWKDFDKDKSGEISYDELLAALNPPKKSLAPIEYTDGKRDKDASAGMSVNVSAVTRTPGQQLIEAFDEISTNRVLDVFNAWDKGGNGSLSRYEFGKAMAALGMKSTKAEIMKLFNTIDTNQNGLIEYRELHAAINDERMG